MRQTRYNFFLTYIQLSYQLLYKYTYIYNDGIFRIWKRTKNHTLMHDYVVKAYLENIDGNSDRITTKAEILYFFGCPTDSYES